MNHEAADARIGGSSLEVEAPASGARLLTEPHGVNSREGRQAAALAKLCTWSIPETGVTEPSPFDHLRVPSTKRALGPEVALR